MSSTTWTTREVASSAAALRQPLWRAVEAQHVAATMALVDSIDEQHAPGAAARRREAFRSAGGRAAALAAVHAVPLSAAARGLALSRSERPRRALRRRRHSHGVRGVRATGAGATCTDSPALTAMPTKPQTVFRVTIDTGGIDLRAPAVRPRSQALDRSVRLLALPAFRPHGAGGRRGRHPLRIGPRSGARGMLRGADTGRVRAAGAARAADVDAVGRPGSRPWQRTHVLEAEEHEFVTASWSRSAH